MTADAGTPVSVWWPGHHGGQGEGRRPRPVDATTDAVRDADWARLVSGRPTSVFHSPAWIRVLSDTYGFPIRARMLRDAAGQPYAGLVYAEVEDIREPRLVSLPFSDFCDPVIADDEEWHALTNGLFDDTRRFDLKCVHSIAPLHDPRLTTVGRARWHAVAVDRGEAEIWRGLHQSARRAIRKAGSAGVTVEYGKSEADLRDFFELHLRVRRSKYGLLAQPYEFFTNIWEQFLGQDRGVLILAKMDDRPVAGCLFLEWQDTLYYKFNASDRDFLPLRPNDRVLWEGLKYARERKLNRMDFGLTDWDQEGLIQYKRKYATEERTITMLRRASPDFPNGRDRSVQELLQQLTDLFVHETVPTEVAERGGAILYRNFA